MRIRNWVFNILVAVLLIPAIVFPSPIIHVTPQYELAADRTLDFLTPFGGEIPSYDAIAALIDRVENGDLDDASETRKEWITHFLVYLSQRGVLPDEEDEEIILEEDIEELRRENGEYFISFDRDYSFQIAPAYLYAQREVIPCKSWIHKRWDKVKKFVKKHKKELLIGVGAVLGAIAAVEIANAISAEAASAALATAGSAAAGLGAGSVSSHDEDDRDRESSEDQSDSLSQVPLGAFSLPDPIEEQIPVFQEAIAERQLQEASQGPQGYEQLKRTVKYATSGALHGMIDAVDTVIGDFITGPAETNKLMGKILPQVREDIQENYANGFTKEEMERSIAKGHQVVDGITGTDFASSYTPEAKEAGNKGVAVLALPSPGGLANAAQMTKPNGIKGWKVGQPKNNLTQKGDIPNWSTVRKRHWKNQALEHANDDKYEPRDLERMRKGLAPQKYNKEKQIWESKELHHVPPQRDGGLFDVVELWPDEHAVTDPKRYLGK